MPGWTIERDVATGRTVISLERDTTIEAVMRDLADLGCERAERLLVLNSSAKAEIHNNVAQPAGEIQPGARSFAQVTKSYLEDRQPYWSPKTYSSVAATLKLLETVLGNPVFNEIRRWHLVKARDQLRLLPPNWKKNPRLRRLTLDELLDHQRRQLEKGEAQTVHVRTLNKWCDSYAALWAFAQRSDDAPKNYAARLALPDAEEKRRRGFTDAELIRIFDSSYFLPGNYDSPFKYWGPTRLALVDEAGAACLGRPGTQCPAQDRRGKAPGLARTAAHRLRRLCVALRRCANGTLGGR